MKIKKQFTNNFCKSFCARVLFSHLQGLVLALCCHHRCDWRTYVGKAFMRDVGFTARDFHVLTRLTSWAVCGTRPAKQGYYTLLYIYKFYSTVKYL